MFSINYLLIMLILMFYLIYRHNQLIDQNAEKLLSPSVPNWLKFIVSIFVLTIPSLIAIYFISPKLFLNFTGIGFASISIFSIFNILFILFKFDSLLSYIRENRISLEFLKKEDFWLVAWLTIFCTLTILNWFREIETTYILEPYHKFVFIYLLLFSISGIILGVYRQSWGSFIGAFAFSKHSFMTIFNPIIIALSIIVLIWAITFGISIIRIN